MTRPMRLSLRARAALCSVALLLLLLAVWQAATSSSPGGNANGPAQSAQSAEETEYLMLMGKIPETGTGSAQSTKVTGFPTPAQFAHEAGRQLAHPFRDDGPNDKGFGIQLGYSLARVAGGYALAPVVGAPPAFLAGLSRVPVIQFTPLTHLLAP